MVVRAHSIAPIRTKAKSHASRAAPLVFTLFFRRCLLIVFGHMLCNDFAQNISGSLPAITSYQPAYIFNASL
jgi:hypothetical protein